MSYSFEMFDLFNNVALERGLERNFISKILKDIKPSEIISKGKVAFGLKVTGLKFPLEFHVDNKGNIFELKGINTRYKTTSIIIIGILLGCDWETQTKFLNNYKLESQIEEVKAILFNKDINIIFYIENDDGRLTFQKEDGYIEIFSKNKTEFKKKFDNFELDINDYQKFASKFFKVQFISKGRDFVTQVHHEVLESIKESFDYIIKNSREILSETMTNRPRKIYSKSLKEYENDLTLLSSLSKILNDFYEKYPNVADLNLYESSNMYKVNEEKIEFLKGKFQMILDKVERYKIEIEGLLGGELIDDEQLVKSPHYWNDPVRSLDKIIESVDDLDGSDIIPLYIELNNDSIHNVNNIAELKILLDALNIKQKKAALYFEFKESYEKYFELKRQIRFEDENLKNINSEIVNLLAINQKYKDTPKAEYDSEVLVSKIKSIKILIEKVGLDIKYEVSELLNIIEKKIKENIYIISEIKNASSKSEYIPYEILNSILFDLNSVRSLLVLKSGNEIDFDSQIKETAKESYLFSKVVNLFNELMRERCKYYYKVIEDSVESVELSSYEFETRMLTTLDGDKISARYGLSGGIDSAMTVRSLASSDNSSMYGTVLLVDEWGDVSDKLAKEVYKTLSSISKFSFGVFVEVSEDEQAKLECIE